MSILERIQRIVRANLDRLLDRVETPEQELEQHLAELEQAYAEGREAAAVQSAHLARLERDCSHSQDRLGQLQAQAEAAVRAGDDAAARDALTQRARLRERQAGLAPALEQSRLAQQQLRDALGQLQDQLQAGRLRLHDLRSRKRLADAQRAFDQTLRGGAFSPADRLEDEVLQAEAEVEVRQDMRAHALGGARLDQQTRRLEIEAELSELKRRLKETS